MGCCSYIHSFVGAFESLWLPEQARWVHLACSGFSASVLKERVFPFINQAWLDQYVVYWPHSFNCVFSGGSRGGARGEGGPGPPPFFRPNWGAKGWKNFFWYQAPPFVRPLIWMSGPATGFYWKCKKGLSQYSAILTLHLVNNVYSWLLRNCMQ